MSDADESESAPGTADMGQHLAQLDEAMRLYFAWYPVAKKEFKDAIRSRGLWVLSLVFTAFFVVPAAGALYFGFQLRTRGGGGLGTEFLISNVYLNIVTFFVPIVTIFVGYAAVTKERTTGSLKILLSLPFSRRDVIKGKVLGRIAVVGVPLVLAYVVTALFLALSETTFKPELFGLFALYTLGFALVMVAIAVGISGAVSTNIRSIIGNFIVYFYFTLAWNAIANEIGKRLGEVLSAQSSLRWHIVLFIKLLNPTQAYKTLTNSMLASGGNAARSARYRMFSQEPEAMTTICGDMLRGNATVVQGLFGNRTVCQAPDSGAGVPLYFSDPAVFVFLLLWIAVAAALSYYYFDQADL